MSRTIAAPDRASAEAHVTMLLAEWKRHLRAMTLWQPWASFMVTLRPGAFGRPVKAVETRCWSCSHRGPTLVHAAKKEPPWVRRIFMEDPSLRQLVERYLLNPGPRREATVYHTSAEEAYDALPRAAVLGIVDVVAIVPSTSAHMHVPGLGLDGDPERPLGDYAPERYAWLTRDMRRLATPVHTRGGQRLWMPQPAVLHDVARQLAMMRA